MGSEKMQEIMGKKILSLAVSDDQNFLKFSTDTGDIIYKAVGECCYETWFADIIGVHSLLGATIINIEEISMDNYNVDDGRGRDDVDKAYGYKLTTNLGTSDIVFRNSSNGYYGGWIEIYSDDQSYIDWEVITQDGERVSLQIAKNKSYINWEVITQDDWKA